VLSNQSDLEEQALNCVDCASREVDDSMSRRSPTSLKRSGNSDDINSLSSVDEVYTTDKYEYVDSDSEEYNTIQVEGHKFEATCDNDCSISMMLNEKPLLKEINYRFLAYEFVNTKCRGSARFFSIPDASTSEIVCTIHNRRVKYEDKDTMHFIECHTYPTTAMFNHCHERIVACRDSTSSPCFLGVVEKMQYKTLPVGFDSVINGSICLYQWKIDKDDNSHRHDQTKGVPYIFSGDSWNNISVHFVHRTFHLPRDYLELVFVNQVMGPTHSGWRNDTLNHKDNGCQSSPSGPDRFHPSCPRLSLFPIGPQKPLHFVGDDYFYMKDGVFHQLNNNKNSFKNGYESAFVSKFRSRVSLCHNREWCHRCRDDERDEPRDAGHVCDPINDLNQGKPIVCRILPRITGEIQTIPVCL
jgi:hypothetical protein